MDFEMSENVLFYAQIAFWVLLFLIVHCYLLFPMTLPFVSEIFKRKKKMVPDFGV